MPPVKAAKSALRVVFGDQAEPLTSPPQFIFHLGESSHDVLPTQFHSTLPKYYGRGALRNLQFNKGGRGDEAPKGVQCHLRIDA